MTTDIKNKKKLESYLKLNWTYTIEIEHDNKGNKIFVVSVNELPGVKTDGESLEEAMDLIQDAMIGAFKLYLKQGEEIPRPLDKNQFPGKIAYRTTSNRHYLLAKEAQKRKLSLSKLIDECIDATIARA